MTAAAVGAVPATRRRAPAWLVAATAAMATLILVLAVVETSITAAWLVDTRGEFISLFGVAFILATDMGLVAGGLLLQTGETLAQVQTRVLGDAASAPLYGSAPGFAVLGARVNVRLTHRVNLIAIGENLTDRNYRLYGSGADAPGANLQIRLRASF